MVRYRKRKVISLANQALITWGTNLVEALNQRAKENIDEKIVVRQIRDYLDEAGADARVRQELLDLIAAERPSAVRNCVRRICFEILIDPSTRVFGSTLFWDMCDKRIWKLMAQRCVNLRCLDLNNAHLSTDEIVYFEKILQRNTKLTKLALPCSHEKHVMQELVNKHCKHLRYLSLPEHDSIALDAEFLSRSDIAKKLTEIELNLSDNIDFEVHTRAIAQILQSCPNIETFKNYRHIGAALRICQTIDADFNCNLKAVRDTKTTQEVLKTIVATCPKLKTLYLKAPRSGSFQALESVVIEEFMVEESFVMSELMYLLKKIGKHLKSFLICGSQEIFDIGQLIKNCPFLEKLKFEYLLNVQVYQETKILQHLQELRVHNSELTDRAMAELLHSAQNISIFDIDKVNIDDGCMRSIFTRDNFGNLKDFNIDVAPKLTIQTVKLLLDCCPSLQTFGYFGAWNVRERDIRSIKVLQEVDGPDLQLNINYLSQYSLLLLLR